MALPLVLAGPIVRRVDARSASVWVACGAPAEVELVLFEGDQKSTGPGAVQSGNQPVGRGTVRTRRMGPHLHVAVAFADGTPDLLRGVVGWALQPGAIYSYDIIINPEGGQVLGLLGLKLLEDDPVGTGLVVGIRGRAIPGVSSDAPRHYALGYEPGRLPSFATVAPFLPEIRIAHTSCRKTNGPGSDALAWLDKLIEENQSNASRRIQQLYLTGDQIYADDVPTCILPMYHDLAMQLMGDGGDSGEEELPSPTQGMRNINMQSAPPMRRTRLIRTDGGFTSVECQNHLLTVGEYAACYLTAWSPRVWLALADEDRCYEFGMGASDFSLTNLGPLFTDKSLNEQVPTTSADLTARLKLKNKPSFDEERQRVIVFAATVGKVARVLANTPTYMIFDDHDVTDDWNLNKTWQDRVYSKPLGRTVVLNALAAYTLFQAWGNDWRAFADPDSVNGRTIRAVEAYLATTRGRSMQQRELLQQLFDLRGGGIDRANFHFEAPGSVYHVRVLDSRTRRTFPVDRVGAPALLGESLDLQMPKRPPEAANQFTIVVGATPVLGPDILEHMIWPTVSAVMDVVRGFNHEEDSDAQGTSPGDHDSSMSLANSRSRGQMFVDVETWPANQAAQSALLSRLASWGNVVVLGGDVHYGTNLHVDWWERDPIQGTPQRGARIVQLTASAARNAANKMGEALYRGYHWLGLWGGAEVEGLGWARGNQVDAHGKYISILRSRLVRADPSIVPARGWPAGTTTVEDPHWRFRQVPDRDTRPDETRSGPFRELAEQLKPDIEAATAMPRGRDRAQRLAALHSNATSLDFAPLRDVVLTNNVGLVRFEEADGKVTVIHTLMSTTVQGYPEDEVDQLLPALRPLGDTARVSTGSGHTEVRIELALPENTPFPLLVGTA